MRLTTVLLMAAFMQVSAATVAQRITLKETNAPLVSVLQKIRQQSGYDILFYNSSVNQSKPVTVSLNQVSVETAMQAIFINSPLTYEITGKKITIKEKSITDKLGDFFQQDSVLYRGKVLDENGKPLPGATVHLKGATNASVTNADGYFERYGTRRNTLVVTYLGYEVKEISLAGQKPSNLLTINLTPGNTSLSQVNVVSTGYQTIPKERATGSFEVVDNELFNRTTSSDILSRLHDVVPGLYFGSTGTTVRGISSLTSLVTGDIPTPLIVLDNIPYDGDISNINPNDVENVTVLKDAAASSIWGTRAGNGVIVITTKKGKYNEKLNISFNANTTITDKPNLFYAKQISTTDEIAVEEFLFKQGYYDAAIGAPNPPPFITPVVDLLNQQRNLPATDATGRAAIDQQINSFKQYDVRNDYLKYMYQNAVAQQYALNLSGGSQQTAYTLSGGFDKNIGNLVNTNGARATIRSNVTFKPFKNLEINTNILYSNTRSSSGGAQGYSPTTYYPYARFADANGNALAPSGAYSMHYIDSLSANPKLLSLIDKPLEDINTTQNKVNSQDILLNLGVKYNINPIFSAEVKYQYENANQNSSLLYDQNSYITRSIIDNYTDPNSFTRAVPLGGIYSSGFGSTNNQTIRGQLDANKTWNDEHELVAIAGAEARESYNESTSFGTVYGYDPTTKNFSYLNTQLNYPTFYGGSAALSDGRGINESYNRFTSVFANAAYTYLKRYTLSASIRKDASNVFGDNTNKQGTPLYSGGFSWNIDKEPFFKTDWLPTLKLRTTYGYSGNVVIAVPAYATAVGGSINSTTFLPFDNVKGIPNPNLRWEKVGMANIGVDFSFKRNIISGSVEYFDKRSTDLIAASPIDLTKGAYSEILNIAALHGRGVDLTLNSNNIVIHDFRWNTNFLFSYNRNTTTKYLATPFTTSQYVNNNGQIDPVTGKDVYGIYAYKWAGLDPLTGDPQGYINGKISKDYASLTNVASINDLQYFGSAVPVYYGSIKNYFTYKRIEISVNITYRLGYYFQRGGINYGGLFSSGTGSSEFANRWQKPGDEKTTNVPSMVFPDDPNRDAFYDASAALIQKGDNVRLQDITASYKLPKIKGIQNLSIYGNISNLGIIWRANHYGIDPDAGTYPNPKTFSFGLRGNF